jgi:iron complex outermembrane recepter protein
LALGWSGVAGAQTVASASSASGVAASGASSAAVGAAAAPAEAQGETSNGKASPGGQRVSEVVVTADRRTTNLQTTAVAATVLTEKDLLNRGVFTVDQLQFVSPSLTVNNFGQGNDFDIRGIGKGEHNTQTGTGVVTYRDGVATFPGYIQEEPFYDVANVEVLRGPQGTFSGQNATGGAVIVTTKDPVIDGPADGYLLGHYGNYDDTGLQGATNIPISDTLAARVAFNLERRNSFYNISGPWTGDPNLMWGSGRVSLLWRPIEQLKVLFKVDYNYLDNGGYFGDSLTDPNGSNGLFNFANNYQTLAVDQAGRAILKIDYTGPGDITFRSVTGYQQGRTAWKGDIDGTDLAAPNYIIAEAVDERMWSQEFNIISPDHKPITWILGAYYDSNNYLFPTGKFDIGVPPGVVDEDLQGLNLTSSEAVFGQLSFNLPAGFQLQVGLRYSTWATSNRVLYYVPEYSLNYPQDETERGNNLTGKVTLNWNLDDNNFLYAFVATGAKPGGLNTAPYFAGGLIPPPFRQEYVTDYEIGWKAKFFDNHLRTQMGGYYNSFDHFQVIIPIPDNPTLTTEENNPNATKLYGFEASAQAVFGDFSANMGLGLEHSSLGTFYAADPRLPATGNCNLETGPVGPNVTNCINLAGHPQTYAPDVTFNVEARYNFRLGNGDIITPSANFSHISDQWGTLFDNAAAGDHLGARDILGSQLAWVHGTFTTTLYGYNLTDDKYVSALLSPIRMAGAPRQFGISVLKTF